MAREFRILEIKVHSFFTKRVDIHDKYKLETLLPDTTLHTGTTRDSRHKNLE